MITITRILYFPLERQRCFSTNYFGGDHEDTTKATSDDKQLNDFFIASYSRNECGSCLVYSGGSDT